MITDKKIFLMIKKVLMMKKIFLMIKKVLMIKKIFLMIKKIFLMMKRISAILMSFESSESELSNDIKIMKFDNKGQKWAQGQLGPDDWVPKIGSRTIGSRKLGPG